MKGRRRDRRRIRRKKGGAGEKKMRRVKMDRHKGGTRNEGLGGRIRKGRREEE